ncbi:MAG TPA: MFS transporter [Candidatus Dormibacteraeota bacterium]|nr:MFS transporter [Candidatus Dormibacteraeota bacterium]
MSRAAGRWPWPRRRRAEPRQGLRANWAQFTLQMAIIFCVGLTVGTERTVGPLVGSSVFQVRSFTYIASFVVSFGVVKAVLNLVGGRLAERFGRRPLLIAGWVVALPIPLLIIAAPDWSWVVAANVLLGVNQGLAWSMSVNAKIDLVGSARRGLAVGLDEAGGYGGVALAALVTGYLAAAYGLRPAPFLLMLATVLLALALTALLMEETLPYARLEAPAAGASAPSFPEIVALASFRDRTMFALSQAGLVEKFVDALVWVAYPLYLAARHLPVERIGTVVFVYGMVWGLAQIPAGHLADLVGRKLPIAAGMLICGAGVLAVPLVDGFWPWVAAAAVTGLGMALLYPNLMTAAADASHPSWRATGLGVYRFWRDGGYAVGALFLGLVANGAGLAASYVGVAAAMGASAAVLIALMTETHPGRRSPTSAWPRRGAP